MGFSCHVLAERGLVDIWKRVTDGAKQLAGELLRTPSPIDRYRSDPYPLRGVPGGTTMRKFCVCMVPYLSVSAAHMFSPIELKNLHMHSYWQKEVHFDFV